METPAKLQMHFAGICETSSFETAFFCGSLKFFLHCFYMKQRIVCNIFVQHTKYRFVSLCVCV